jgi:hypothetical protein
MNRIVTLLIVSVFFFSGLKAQEQEELTAVIQKIAQELETKHAGPNKIKIAILQFRTKDNKLTKFNEFIQDELFQAYRNSKRFEVIDQNAINDMIQSYGWTNDKARNFVHNENFGKYIFDQVGYVANAIIFGTIADNDETITLTTYLVPNGVNRNIMSVEKFNSSPFTDKLLGKPIRERKVEPKVVVVEKEVIVEKPVIVEKIVEKEVIVEKPVIVEKEVIVERVVEKEVIVEKPVVVTKPAVILKSKLGDYEFEITSVTFQGNKIVITIIARNNLEDGYIYGLDARFFDTEGNEFNSGIGYNTMRDRKLIKGVPLKAVINFEENKVARVTEMQALELNVYKAFGHDMLGTIRFHNVPVTR